MNKLCWLIWCLVAVVLFLSWRDDSRTYNGKSASGTVGKGYSGGSWSTKWYITPAKELRSEVRTYDGEVEVRAGGVKTDTGRSLEDSGGLR